MTKNSLSLSNRITFLYLQLPVLNCPEPIFCPIFKSSIGMSHSLNEIEGCLDDPHSTSVESWLSIRREVPCDPEESAK